MTEGRLGRGLNVRRTVAAGLGAVVIATAAQIPDVIPSQAALAETTAVFSEADIPEITTEQAEILQNFDFVFVSGLAAAPTSGYQGPLQDSFQRAGIPAVFTDLPNRDHPNLADSKAKVKGLIQQSRRPLILVVHSLAGPTVMELLRTDQSIQIDGLVMVAPAVENSDAQPATQRPLVMIKDRLPQLSGLIDWGNKVRQDIKTASRDSFYPNPYQYAQFSEPLHGQVEQTIVEFSVSGDDPATRVSQIDQFTSGVNAQRVDSSDLGTKPLPGPVVLVQYQNRGHMNTPQDARNVLSGVLQVAETLQGKR